MKLFLALSTADAANDAALPGLRRNGITADANLLIEAVAAADADADADDVDASHHQDALDNQADSVSA